ncbi:MAG: phosphoribosylanthranilate isomerase [Victivallales bacterium]|nr:phosphoribosylanthranilate isomerase [Victivallales bacterium]
MNMFIKICGITRREDAEFAISSGTDALGFIAYPPSPRYISPDNVARIIGKLVDKKQCVGVFVNAAINTVREYMDAGIDTVQLHGDESEEFAENCSGMAEVWKAIRARSRSQIASLVHYPCDKFLVDAFDESLHGGTGQGVDGDIAKFAVTTLPRPVILAGGLNPANFANAAAAIRPFGLDFNSGVESSPGVKDHALIAKLFSAVRSPSWR